LCSRNYQGAAVMIRSFVKDFSPIIDVVKDFAAPYGGMAVGTISVLFVVRFSLCPFREYGLIPIPGRCK